MKFLERIFPKCRYCGRRHNFMKYWCPDNLKRDWKKSQTAQTSLTDLESTNGDKVE